MINTQRAIGTGQTMRSERILYFLFVPGTRWWF